MASKVYFTREITPAAVLKLYDMLGVTLEGNVASAGTVSNGGAVVEKVYPISNQFIVYIC